LKRILAISDIHGQADAMERLLAHAKYNPKKDRLFLLGDYIGKGSNSSVTLHLVKQYVQDGAVALRGNHEQRVIKECKKGDHLWKWKPFLTSLPYWYEDSDFLFVHAGIRPGIPLKKQKPIDLITIRKPFLDQSFSFKKTIVFGHTPTDRLGVSRGNLWVNKNKIGIDTGAGHGNFLSLADLSNRLQYQVPVGGKKKIHPKKASF
jgi:serine/threonine protein phosphatase 1